MALCARSDKSVSRLARVRHQRQPAQPLDPGASPGSVARRYCEQGRGQLTAYCPSRSAQRTTVQARYAIRYWGAPEACSYSPMPANETPRSAILSSAGPFGRPRGSGGTSRSGPCHAGRASRGCGVPACGERFWSRAGCHRRNSSTMATCRVPGAASSRRRPRPPGGRPGQRLSSSARRLLVGRADVVPRLRAYLALGWGPGVRAASANFGLTHDSI